MKNPWTTLSSKLVYQNPWITVREHQVLTPSGDPGIYGVVETRVAVGIVALTESREIFLVGQYRYAVDAYSWEIIEGGSDGEEDALETARRELQEEAGIRAERWTQLGPDIHLSNCHSSEVAVLYLAEGLQIGMPSPDPTELLCLRKVRIDDALAEASRGEIQDAMTLLALHRLVPYLASRDASESVAR